MQNNPANQYIVRVWKDGQSCPGTIEFHPWAFSAEDARFQVETEMKRGSVSFYVTYVGPVNAACKCANQCHCGCLTADEAKYRSEITKKPPPTPMPSRGVP